MDCIKITSGKQKPYSIGKPRSENPNAYGVYAVVSAEDWCANTDVIMSDEMKAYRQALRDVTRQSCLPHDMAWPNKPMEQSK